MLSQYSPDSDTMSHDPPSPGQPFVWEMTTSPSSLVNSSSSPTAPSSFESAKVSTSGKESTGFYNHNGHATCQLSSHDENLIPDYTSSSSSSSATTTSSSSSSAASTAETAALQAGGSRQLKKDMPTPLVSLPPPPLPPPPPPIQPPSSLSTLSSPLPPPPTSSTAAAIKGIMSTPVHLPEKSADTSSPSRMTTMTSGCDSLTSSYGNLSVVSTPLLDNERSINQGSEVFQTSGSMPSRGYVAGKPVSRWEADSDNIDIEYKNLDKPMQQTKYCAQCLSGRKGMAIKILFVLSVFFLGLILGYVIKGEKHNSTVVTMEPAPDSKFVPIQQDYDPDIRDQLQARVTHVGNFEDSLETLTREVRLSGVGGTNRVLNYVRDWWLNFNFDSVSIKNYTVRLVYPDYVAQEENHVAVMSDNNTLVFETWTNNSNIHPDITPFNAYSASGDVRGKIVYCNYGRRSDYEWLARHKVQVFGTIHLIRYGKIHPSNKIKSAEENGAKGVILYPDPAEYCNGLTNVTGTWWLRGDQVPSQHVRYWLTGDPSTPDYPALMDVPRENPPKGSRPAIPVYPVSYNDAEYLMRNMGGNSTDDDWHGALNVSYKTGPGFSGPWEKFDVHLNVSNTYTLRPIHNVIAVLRGAYEKDHYVIIGAHIDAWGYGAVDAGTSFAVIMDLARTFSAQVTRGWRPRRTIIFALWDASKYGHVGAYEWVQEYEKQLTAGGVAYINIDSAIRGNYTFYAESNPLLYDVIYKAAMSVSWKEDLDGDEDKSVYNVWKERDNREGVSSTRPWINNLNGDQDHSPFMYRIGMSSLLTAFTYNMKAYPNLPTYPAHNTLQDTMEYVLNIDPDYSLHSTLVQILSDIVLQLSDSAIIPMNVNHYSIMLQQGLSNVQSTLTSMLGMDKTDLLKSTIAEFTSVTQKFQAKLDSTPKQNLTEFEALEINDKLIRLSRAFIYEGGLLHEGQLYRNVLIAPHPQNLNEEVLFPGLVTASLDSDDSRAHVLLQRELVILVVALKRAKDILLDDFGPNLVRDDL